MNKHSAQKDIYGMPHPEDWYLVEFKKEGYFKKTQWGLRHISVDIVISHDNEAGLYSVKTPDVHSTYFAGTAAKVVELHATHITALTYRLGKQLTQIQKLIWKESRYN